MRVLSRSPHLRLTGRGHPPSMAIRTSSDTSWDLTEGDVLSQGLDVVKLLGGGRAFQAYLAWSEHRHALVVAKVLRPHLVEDAAARATLEREAGALAALAHPALPRLFEARLDEARPLVVLELLDGPRLSTVIRRFGLAIEQVLPLALELCSVLHYLQAEGWVHRDVKPANVILAAPPRLVDLSVAARVGRVRRGDATAGTDAYMAPEQCEPALFRQIGPAADVWGLGATLYEAVSGRRPFAAGDERFPQLHELPRPLPDRVPAPVAAAVMACLEFRPADRPRAAELGDALEPLVGALPAPRIGRFRPRRINHHHHQEVLA